MPLSTYKSHIEQKSHIAIFFHWEGPRKPCIQGPTDTSGRRIYSAYEYAFVYKIVYKGRHPFPPNKKAARLKRTALKNWAGRELNP